MNQPPSAHIEAELRSPTGPDPELEALPKPRRPGRVLTIVTMTLTVVAAAFMFYAIEGEARYALQSSTPLELGTLPSFAPAAGQANHYAHGEGSLSDSGGIGYSRPLESDSYRLVPIAGNDRLWVQVRVPEGLDGARFVPPNSFTGRLVPISDAGLRYRGLELRAGVPKNAWLLIDGEAPRTTRWALGLVALFAAFAAFNVYGLVRLLRPVKDA